MTSGPPPKDHIVSFSLPIHANGILPDRMIAAMAESGLILPAYPFVESQIQPASLDLRLGDIAYRVRASFLPGSGARSTVLTKVEELKTHELDSPVRAYGLEAEVRQEVARKHRPVDNEPVVHRDALCIAVRKRLQRLRAAVLRVTDRGEEERLHHPRRGGVDDVGAGDEHGL